MASNTEIFAAAVEILPDFGEHWANFGRKGV
jgi:hypothetical protein